MTETKIKELKTSDFKYFIVIKGLMVAGVYDEDDDYIYLAFLKGEAYDVGATTKILKKDIADQARAGIASIVKSYDEAMSFNIENRILPEVVDFINEK